MSLVAWFAVAIAGAFLAAMATGIWFAVAKVNEELGLFVGFEGMHFED